MHHIFIAAEDREALGAPEVLKWEKPRLKEERELKRQCGISMVEMGRRIAEGDIEALAMLAWLALARAGVSVAWEDLDLDLEGIDIKDPDANPKEKPSKKTN